MKTRRALLLSNTYSTRTSQSAFDISQTNDASQENFDKRNLLKVIEIESNETRLIKDLHQLIDLFPDIPTLLTGPLRHLKNEPHYREPTCRLWLTPQTYRKTSKIRLTGNWIEKAGFVTHERIRVIPMHRILIIVSETGCTNEHESETNEDE
jgi:hypothetical protein